MTDKHDIPPLNTKVALTRSDLLMAVHAIKTIAQIGKERGVSTTNLEELVARMEKALDES